MACLPAGATLDCEFRRSRLKGRKEESQKPEPPHDQRTSAEHLEYSLARRRLRSLYHVEVRRLTTYLAPSML
jgi:hypothetical protein